MKAGSQFAAGLLQAAQAGQKVTGGERRAIFRTIMNIL
jgi:hypothetical protein